MGELHQERGAERSGIRRHMAVKPTAALATATLLSLAALAVIIGLTAHAGSSRAHEEAIDDVAMQLNELQGMPWRLETSGSTVPKSADVGAVRANMLATERDVARSLKRLGQDAPVPGLSAASAPVQKTFSTLNGMVDLVARGQVPAASALVPSAFASENAAVQSLDRASERYQSQTASSLGDATVGAVAAVLLLLAGFAFYLLRAFRAHAASDALADELGRSRAHLEQAQLIAGVGSIEWDLDGRILSFSAEHSRLHGWTDLEPPRGPSEVLDLVAPADRARVAAALQAAAANRTPVELDYRMREAYGGRLIHLQAKTVTGADGRRRMIGTSQDLTERFRHAEAERANRAKNEFISRMSHELRTPLNAVLGFGQLMTMSDLDERQHANVEHILAAGHHLLDLINEILDISRIESGELRMSPEPVSVGGVIGDAIDLVTPIAELHGIAVQAELRDDDLWVHADLGRLRQVLLNLLSNAVKYNHEAGHVNVVASRIADARVQIVVRDDGPGIAPEMIDRLFSPFERLGAEHGTVEGTGLGLAVSRGIIEAMGGRITAESNPGNGAAFMIELEAAAAVSDATALPHDGPFGEVGLVPTPMRVLCIEDNPSNLSLIEQILAARPNVQLLTALTGERGVQLAREQAPELILLDLNLPDLSGDEALARLKRDSATQEIPVVVLSADMSSAQLEHLLALGAGSYLSKPVDVIELLHFVDHPNEALRPAA